MIGMSREECLTPPSVKRIKSEENDTREYEFGSPPKIRRSVNIELSRDNTGNCSPPRLMSHINFEPDNYDEYGRNLTEQMKRQNKIPWIKVKYNRGRLVIPEEKRFLNSL